MGQDDALLVDDILNNIMAIEKALLLQCEELATAENVENEHRKHDCLCYARTVIDYISFAKMKLGIDLSG